MFEPRRWGAGEPRFIAPHRLLAAGVATSGSGLDVDGRQALSRHRKIIALEPRAGEKRLDAAGVPAKTLGTRPLVVGGPRQWIVAPLAGDSVRSHEHVAAHYDAAADSCAENRTEHRLRILARTIACLRKRETVGVVADSHFATEQRPEIGLDRLPIERDGVRAPKQAGCARDRARRADADCAGLTELCFGAAHQHRNRAENAAVVLVRRCNAPAQQLPTV